MIEQPMSPVESQLWDQMQSMREQIASLRMEFETYREQNNMNAVASANRLLDASMGQ